MSKPRLKFAVELRSLLLIKLREIQGSMIHDETRYGTYAPRNDFSGIIKMLEELDVVRIEGTCCSCGYKGTFETPCSTMEDGTHCDHWWDGMPIEEPNGQ